MRHKTILEYSVDSMKSQKQERSNNSNRDQGQSYFVSVWLIQFVYWNVCRFENIQSSTLVALLFFTSNFTNLHRNINLLSVVFYLIKCIEIMLILELWIFHVINCAAILDASLDFEESKRNWWILLSKYVKPSDHT